MEFYIEKHSSSSVVRQIQEQIKVAVSMGVFRRGDTLPSIRDVEKQTGINRGLVHKAYLGLRRSGLLTLARGKGTIISTDTPSPPGMNEECRQWSVDITSRARKAGISPTAFARYFSRHAQEDERNAPSIAYVDRNKQDATEIAQQISQLWQVPVTGLTIEELKDEARDGSRLRKVLVNYFFHDHVKSLLPGRKIDVIPIATRGSGQTGRALARIKPNSSVLLIIPREVSAHASFILAQFPKLIASRGVEISHVSVHNVRNFEKMFHNSRYDLFLLSPGTHEKVPRELRSNPRILLMRMEVDPASVEAARIRAGVVV
jgi:DNA-binding transcriptional regulator YhcF (GntR family)